MKIARDTNGNMIIGDLSLQHNVKIHWGGGRNNIIFFAGCSQGIDVTYAGNNGILFVGNNCITYSNVSKIFIGGNSICFLDKNITTVDGINLWCFEGKNIFIGRDCMFSYRTDIRTAGSHFIYNCLDNSRTSKAQSIYIGDHIWIGLDVSILKQIFIASGAIIGLKSVLAGNKIFYSNTTNAGIPCKEISKNVFWIREDSLGWTKPLEKQTEIYDDKIYRAGWSKQMEAEFESYNDDSFKYAFEKDKFLNPSLIDKKLESFDNSIDKLIFLYNYIYCNHNKNRFALFCDSDFRDCALYCEDENAFAKIEFEPMMQINYE